MAVRTDFQWLTTHSSSRLTAGVDAVLSNAALSRIVKTVIETIFTYPFIFCIANGDYLVVIVNPAPRSGSSNARLSLVQYGGASYKSSCPLVRMSEMELVCFTL